MTIGCKGFRRARPGGQHMPPGTNCSVVTRAEDWQWLGLWRRDEADAKLTVWLSDWPMTRPGWRVWNALRPHGSRYYAERVCYWIARSVKKPGRVGWRSSLEWNRPSGHSGGREVLERILRRDALEL